ncbi:MAG: radical SAM protein [Clostridiales bacterium 43-6]|nr:MAG: radical SAM protein [Clostridiales bacterium 43-6]
MMITYEVGENLYINTTNRCSNACEFCIRTRQEGYGTANSLWLKEEPTKEEILEDILKRDLEKYPELVFCGFGEPFYRIDDILWVVKKLKETKLVTVRINTNGLGDLILGYRVSPKLEGIIDIVSISLNASNAKDYDAICHPEFGEQSFEAMLTFAKTAKEYVPLVIFSVVDVIGTEEIEACRRIAKDCGVEFRIRDEL